MLTKKVRVVLSFEKWDLIHRVHSPAPSAIDSLEPDQLCHTMLFNLYLQVNNAMCTLQLTKLQISVPWSARFVIPPLANMKADCA